MKARWYSIINDIKLLIDTIKKLIHKLKRQKQREKESQRGA
jgi:hypothetical protein